MNFLEACFVARLEHALRARPVEAHPAIDRARIAAEAIADEEAMVEAVRRFNSREMFGPSEV